ncbi:MAG: DNA repair protein RadA, partial [Lachnospiraceae bacterium]
MAKSKGNGFFCSQCGYETSKWSGQCPSCHEWNSFVEAPVSGTTVTKGVISGNSSARGVMTGEIKSVSLGERS